MCAAVKAASTPTRGETRAGVVVIQHAHLAFSRGLRWATNPPPQQRQRARGSAHRCGQRACGAQAVVWQLAACVGPAARGPDAVHRGCGKSRRATRATRPRAWVHPAPSAGCTGHETEHWPLRSSVLESKDSRQFQAGESHAVLLLQPRAVLTAQHQVFRMLLCDVRVQPRLQQLARTQAEATIAHRPLPADRARARRCNRRPETHRARPAHPPRSHPIA
jgi:hypothetical protein